MSYIEKSVLLTGGLEVSFSIFSTPLFYFFQSLVVAAIFGFDTRLMILPCLKR